MHSNFVMSIENRINQGFAEMRHSHRYGELRQVSEMSYFEVVSIRNRLFNAKCVLKSQAINNKLQAELEHSINQVKGRSNERLKHQI